MNCLAVWYEHKPSRAREKLDIELHLNLWKLNKKNGEKESPFKNFLDIGIKILEPSNVANICIFTPFKVSKKEIEDLGHYFEDDNRLVAAIFNEEFNSTASTQSKTLQIKDAEDNIQFYVYMVDIKNDVVRPPKNYGGTVIRIKVRSHAGIKPLYYRIRINSDKLEELYTQYKPESTWLESHSTNTELIDFRVNEKRNLDKSLLEEMHDSGVVNFKRVDYFVMREFKYDYVSSQTEMIRSRRLEEDLWDSYVGDDCECGKIIAYHWKWPVPPEVAVRGFNAFVKYRFLTSDRKTRRRFFLFLLFVGFLGGGLGTLLMKLIEIWWK